MQAIIYVYKCQKPQKIAICYLIIIPLTRYVMFKDEYWLFLHLEIQDDFRNIQ